MVLSVIHHDLLVKQMILFVHWQIMQQIWVSLYTVETITLAFLVIRVFLSSTLYLGVLQIEC